MKQYDPAFQELIRILRFEVQQSQRPANEIILDDQDVMRNLKISKRKLQYLKAAGILPIRKIEPNSPRTYYWLSDILDLLKQNSIEAIKPKF